MELFDVGFVTVRLVDILDISIVTFLFYLVYDKLRGSLALRITGVIISTFVLWKVVDLLDFRLLGTILQEFLGLGALAVVIIFAPEIRRFLSAISKNTLLDRIIRQVSPRLETNSTSREVIDALKTLRATGNGALIVFAGQSDLGEIMESGDALDANITARLIYSLFQKESPLHDGAMILENNRIAAVRTILPVSKREGLDPELGLRHRSALGLAEVTDALVIIASEERRELSMAYHGELQRNVDYQDIEDAVKAHYAWEKSS
ncbi:diadenylate cyclase [Pontibacter sp. G13]|uniref:diadenylate cyclase n=1 Tax=Pontibacter sp. G13 TaxID=3074898 RepID=UPI00288A3FB4|nr:diadenylate cyclase [Pontibacter sp. G13]WNJ20852.1 diadenylate cyclase [Pontibacter sp. G13]